MDNKYKPSVVSHPELDYDEYLFNKEQDPKGV